MIDKLGKAILLFGNPNGDHLEGMVVIEGRLGNCFWNLIPIPQNQNAGKNQGPEQSFGKPYRRSGQVGFRGR